VCSSDLDREKLTDEVQGLGRVQVHGLSY